MLTVVMQFLITRDNLFKSPLAQVKGVLVERLPIEMMSVRNNRSASIFSQADSIDRREGLHRSVNTDEVELVQILRHNQIIMNRRDATSALYRPFRLSCNRATKKTCANPHFK